jgi:hypothetical protein
MKAPSRLISFALLLFVCLLVVPLVARELMEYEEEEEETEIGNDRPGEAMAFRTLSLRSDSGAIAADGLMSAKRQVDAMKTRLAAQTLAESQDDPFAALSIPLTRSGWTWIGPGNIGGRVRAIIVHPTSTNTMFAGSVSGGIWKTTNGGARWAAVDDFMANLAVTSMLFHPTNPQTMYAATGEGFSNADAIRGAGIFKSVDGGTTWSQLSSTTGSNFHYVLRLAISPDGRVLLAGTTTGLYRSTNAGGAWTRVAAVPAAFDVDFHPSDSRRAIAGDRSGRAWHTTDGGATWRQSVLALPGTSGGSFRVETAYAKGSPDVAYAVIDRNGGLVYRSVDGGASFTAALRSDGVTLLENGQGWYDIALWVNPRDANDLLVGGVNQFRSRDGGQSFVRVSSPATMHADQHVIVEHPRFDNAANRTLFIGNDGGVYKVADLAAVTSSSSYAYEALNNNLGITQFYGAAGNPSTGVIVGGTQDNGTLTFDPGSGSEGWNAMFGGDGGFSAADPTDPNYFYGEYVYLELHRSSNGGRSSTFIFSGLPDAGTRANFIAPFILDPNQPSRMLAGGQSLWRSNNIKASMPTWQSIKSGSASNYISAIAVAPVNSSIIWVGHNNGDVYRTTNGTATTPSWTKVDPTSFPNRFVTRITIDPFDSSVVYASFGGFTDHNIQRTDNAGATWTDATGTGATGLPLAPVRDVEVDPTDANVIWAGTEVGVFTSRNRGATWDATHDGPANVSVDELFVLDDHLYAVTHGRGLFRHPLQDDSGAPGLSFSPASRAFPSTNVGSRSAAAPITVVNSGTASLAVTRVALTGTHPSSFTVTSDGCTGEGIAPGASCVIQIAFQPTATGRRTAAISVTSNAAGSPHAAALSGDGLAAPAPSLPAPWTTRDIGSVGTAGSASFSGGTFTVRGAGADVWGTADAFRYVYQPLSGDGDIVARVASVENVAAWVKAGVMIRQSVNSNSAHAFMIVSAGKGLAFQRRRTAGGVTTHTAGSSGTAPRWVKLARRGQAVTASTSTNGTTWTVVGQDTISLSGSVLVGLAVSSHVTARTATVTFDNVRVTSVTASTGLPAGWRSRDVGAVGTAGAASESAGRFTVTGAGPDIWGTADAFQFAHTTLTGDGSIVARVASARGPHAWTKVGVMIRGASDPGAAHATMLVSTGKGLAFQRRAANRGLSTNTSGGAGTAPRWVRLVRAGNVVTGSVSSNGTTWTVVGRDTITLPASALVGLVVSSHQSAQLATAVFENVAVVAR